ncbi:Sua5/YciO/YrdC/YwlC family protein [Arsukibacterium sp.]|uniref:Sua5/YciO/YrdC/YwlC family protein n=1 Tax=Arsukibacterium sp. TaxID=1977258 RepID=UPI002FDA8A00
MACELTGLSLGIGSEGSFGGGPVPGLLNWDDELLCLYDSVKQRFIIARASGLVPLFHLETDQIAQLRAHLEKQDKGQGWICSFSSAMVKGLVGFAAVYDALEQHGLLLSSDRLSEVAVVTPSMRPLLNPLLTQLIVRFATLKAAVYFTFCRRAPVLNTLMLNSDIADDIKTAMQLLKQGKLVAVPTETVYGLAANARDKAAVLRDPHKISIYTISYQPF